MFKYLTLILLSSTLSVSDISLLEKDIPSMPRNALRKLAGNSPFEEIFLEKDENANFYHAKWKNGATTTQASVTEDGNLAIFIEAVDENNVPTRVKKTVDSLFSKASTKEYEKEMFLVYKVKAEFDNKTYEALISPSGKMVGIKESTK